LATCTRFTAGSLLLAAWQAHARAMVATSKTTSLTTRSQPGGARRPPSPPPWPLDSRTTAQAHQAAAAAAATADRVWQRQTPPSCWSRTACHHTNVQPSAQSQPT
jgi:hypothetical protein